MSRINDNQITEKNLLESSNVLLHFLEIRYQDEKIRIVNDNMSHFWRGEYWEGFYFNVSGISGALDGQSSVGTASVPNMDRVIGRYFDETDGLENAVVVYRATFSNQLDDDAPIFEYEFAVNSTEDDEQNGILHLGHGYAVNSRRPERIHLTNTCDRQYGSIQCGVSTSVISQYPQCNRNLKDCRIRGNSKRFGGEPAIPIGGAYAI